MTFVGAEIQPILTAGIIIGVVAVLALRGVAENFAAGIVLQTRRPIELGDDIDVLDHSGIVREINSRAVILEGWDRRRIHIPNRTVLNNPLVNHTEQRRRRSEVEVRWRSAETLDEAVSAVVETVLNVPGVIADPTARRHVSQRRSGTGWSSSCASPTAQPGKLIASRRTWCGRSPLPSGHAAATSR